MNRKIKLASIASVVFAASVGCYDVVQEPMDGMNNNNNMPPPGGGGGGGGGDVVLDTNIVAKPTNPSDDTTADFTFSASKPRATFQCSLDGAEYEACNVQYTTAELEAGPHLLSVRAVDPDGKLDESPAVYAWRINVVEPEQPIDTMIVLMPTDPTNDTSGDFVFSSNKPAATFECSLDSAVFSACTAAFTTVVLTDGPHSLQVRAILETEIDATPASFAWRIDTTVAMPPPMGETPRDLFNRTVAPILQASCSADACHGGVGTSPLKYLPPNIADYYDTVVSYDDRVVGYFDKTIAPVLTQANPGPHYAVSYTPAQVADISAWLDAELAARNTGTPPPPGMPVRTPGTVSRELIAEWSGCMDLAQWNAENVAQEWSQLGSGEGPCNRCHQNGQASFIATDESERMFNILTTNRYFMLSYFTPNVTDLNNARMEINTSSFQRVANGIFPHIEHPNFDENSDAMAALIRFYDQTMARKAAGTCAPPRMTNP